RVLPVTRSFPTRRSSDLGDATSTISLAFHPRIVSGHPAVIKTLEYRAASQKYKQGYELFRYIDDISSADSADEPSSYQLLQNAIDRKSARLNSSHVSTSY